MPLSRLAQFCWSLLATSPVIAHADAPPHELAGAIDLRPPCDATAAPVGRALDGDSASRPTTPCRPVARRRSDLLASYRAAGIAGGRLALLATRTGHMVGLGGVPLATPAQLALAPVMFELLGPDACGRYTLRRYQLRGDDLVVTTTGDFAGRPGPEHYR